MAKTRVYHVLQLDRYWCKDNDPAPDELTLVAEIDGDLDAAFYLTQNIEESWTKNKKVDAKVDEARSTSVGDLIVDSDGIGHIILPAGFRTAKKHLQSWVSHQLSGDQIKVSKTQEKSKVSPALRKIAKDAIECQNGCNLSGISHSYMQALGVVWNEQKEGRLPQGTDAINKHPVLQLFINKMGSLSGAEYAYSTAHAECEAIVNAPEEEV